MRWYLAAFGKATDFEGRARRREYWFFTLFFLLGNLILQFIDIAVGMYDLDLGFGLLSGLHMLVHVLPNIAVSVRRLHDTDRSGWWYFLFVVPIIGWVWYFVLMVLNGQSQENRFGRDPKAA